MVVWLTALESLLLEYGKEGDGISIELRCSTTILLLYARSSSPQKNSEELLKRGETSLG